MSTNSANFGGNASDERGWSELRQNPAIGNTQNQKAQNVGFLQENTAPGQSWGIVMHLQIIQWELLTQSVLKNPEDLYNFNR